MSNYDTIAASNRRAHESDYEHADRVELCTVEANINFALATSEPLDVYRQRISDIAPYLGSPRWERMKNNALREFHEAARPAHELFLRTFEDLMRDGVVSDATTAAWNELLRPTPLSIFTSMLNPPPVTVDAIERHAT